MPGRRRAYPTSARHRDSGGRGHKIRRYLAMLSIAGTLSAGALVAGAAAASAHNPSISASCQGVTAAGSGYEPKDINTLMVTLDGVTRTETFKVNATLTVPVPQDGKVHSWSAWVTTSNNDPSYTKTDSGDIGPCGESTPDSEKISFCHFPADLHRGLQTVSKNAFYVSGHIGHPKDIYPAGSIKKSGVTFSWSAQGDQSLLKTDCVAPPPIEIAVPATPQVTDPCGRGNAAWVVPADGGNIRWELKAGGDLVATADTGYTFPGGKASHDFGQAPETNVTACPVVLASVGVAAPVLTGPTCTAPGKLSYSDAVGYTWNRTEDHGNVVLTAMPTAGFTLTGTTSWTFTAAQLDQLSGAQACPPVSTPVVTPPAVIPPKVEGVKHTAPPKAPTVTPVVKGIKQEAAPVLPRTGTEASLYGAAGVLLLLVGSGLVLATRREDQG